VVFGLGFRNLVAMEFGISSAEGSLNDDDDDEDDIRLFILTSSMTYELS
jgi:hypothetical protein